MEIAVLVVRHMRVDLALTRRANQTQNDNIAKIIQPAPPRRQRAFCLSRLEIAVPVSTSETTCAEFS
jgi:hypothetical protein